MVLAVVVGAELLLLRVELELVPGDLVLVARLYRLGRVRRVRVGMQVRRQVRGKVGIMLRLRCRSDRLWMWDGGGRTLSASVASEFAARRRRERRAGTHPR